MVVYQVIRHAPTDSRFSTEMETRFFFVGRDEPFFLLLLFFLLKNSEPLSHSFGVCFVCFLIYRALCWQFCRWSGNHIFSPSKSNRNKKKKKFFFYVRDCCLRFFLWLYVISFPSFVIILVPNKVGKIKMHKVIRIYKIPPTVAQ